MIFRFDICHHFWRQRTLAGKWTTGSKTHHGNGDHQDPTRDAEGVNGNAKQLQDGIPQIKRGKQYNGHGQVGREIGFVPGHRRLVAGHTNEDRDNPHRVDQGKQTNKKLKICWKIKERLDHV